MPKIVSHPSFSSELENLFPMLSLQVLHFLTISSSLGSKTQFSVHGAVQTSVSISCFDSMVCGRRGFSPCAALTPVTASPAFILHSLGCGAACISLILLLPRQGYSLARSNHCGGSLHRVFESYLAFHCLKHFILKYWFAAGSKGSGRIWILKIWDTNPFP